MVRGTRVPKQSADILRKWASLYAPALASWTPIRNIIHVAEAESQTLKSTLKGLLDQSDSKLQLVSLCDPLLADAGLNRWLREEREEAYSDWLAWIFEQMDAADVLAVLGMSGLEVRATSHLRHFDVKREMTPKASATK